VRRCWPGLGQGHGHGHGQYNEGSGRKEQGTKKNYFCEVSAVSSSPNPFANGRITAFQLLQPPIS